MDKITNDTAHRPWPLERGPWIMAQTWHDLLFAHWPVPVAALRSLIPQKLEIDTFEGQAWLTVVPFRMSGVRLRLTPALPWLSSFPELNVRTYVTRDDRPGVWFFSLDAANTVAVEVARRWFHLPYFRARMILYEQDNWIGYQSSRTHSGVAPATLTMRYRAVAPPHAASAGTLEYFLTERYCLYAADPRGCVLRSEIHHPPWLLQSAEAVIEQNTMAVAAGIAHPHCPPLLQFSRRQDVVVWPPRQIA